MAVHSPDTRVERTSTPALRPLPEPPQQRRLYLRVRTRFVISVLAAVVWAAGSLLLDLHWIGSLGQMITPPLAWVVVLGIAVVPGYLNMQLCVSLLVDRPRPLVPLPDYPPVTLIVAAYNEQDSILETLDYAFASDYPGWFEVVVVDDGSTDATAARVAARAAGEPRLRLLHAAHAGKAAALNLALATIETPLVATIDADTLLMSFSLRRAVERLGCSPADTVAVAGAVLARNSRANLLTRVQEWDYFLGIASVKRQQALLQGTLVAQGAFSVYSRDAVAAVGGWPDCIGEDIVLTWAMIRDGGRTTFEPSAVAFTEVPTEPVRFVRQRQRWARGMIEGLRNHGFALLGRRRLHVHSILVNSLFPYLDGVYTLAFLPGVVLACLGNFAIVGPLTVAVMPVAAGQLVLMHRLQKRVFVEVGLRVRHNPAGLALYFLFYSVLLAPVSFLGYVKELVGRRRVW